MDHLDVDTDALNQLTNPVVVLAFSGWNDAAAAASTALATLCDASDATKLGRIDPEPFTDFATVRPSVVLDDDQQRQIVWPAVEVFGARMPGTDVLLIAGPEPALRWRSFSEQIVRLCHAVEAPLALSLGALLADVPHTRPTRIFGTSSDTSVIERFELRRSTYQGPTGIVGVVDDALRRADVPTASLWAAVPGYIAQLSSPAAAIALVERACQMMGTPAPTLELAEQVDSYHRQVESLIEADDDLGVYVERLEQMYDESDDDDDTPATGIDDTDPTRLAAEIEQFLRDHDDS